MAAGFGEIAAAEQKSLLGRYQLLDVIVKNSMKSRVGLMNG